MAKLSGKGIGWYLRIPIMAYRVVRHYALVLKEERGGNYTPPRKRAWNTDPTFSPLFEEVSDHCAMGKEALHNIWQFALQAASIPGDAAEVGVYKAGTARLLARTLGKDKTIHLFDTFEGMPVVNKTHDLHNAGDFSDSSFSMVKAYLKDCPNVQFHQGFFPSTAGPVENTKFSLVHLDADIYQSTKDGCIFFYPRMERGGIIVFHDYEIPSCPGVKVALDEYFADKPERVFYLPTNQAFIVKI